MFGKKWAHLHDPEEFQLLTVEDLPMTFKRKVRKFFTGSRFSEHELSDGRLYAMSHLGKARFFVGTADEEPGTRALLAQQNHALIMHFTVKRALNPLFQ